MKIVILRLTEGALEIMDRFQGMGIRISWTGVSKRNALDPELRIIAQAGDVLHGGSAEKAAVFSAELRSA